jgi:hypothetical protein
VNTHIRRRIAGMVILGVGFLSLWLVPGVRAISPSTTPIPQSPPEHSQINRSIPGAKTGMLKAITENIVQIDAGTYRFSPRVVVETQTGEPLSRLPQWQKRIEYPVPVQYWADKNVITQMIVLSRVKDGPAR